MMFGLKPMVCVMLTKRTFLALRMRSARWNLRPHLGISSLCCQHELREGAERLRNELTRDCVPQTSRQRHSPNPLGQPLQRLSTDPVKPPRALRGVPQDRIPHVLRHLCGPQLVLHAMPEGVVRGLRRVRDANLLPNPLPRHVPPARAALPVSVNRLVWEQRAIGSPSPSSESGTPLRSPGGGSARIGAGRFSRLTQDGPHGSP